MYKKTLHLGGLNFIYSISIELRHAIHHVSTQTPNNHPLKQDWEIFCKEMV